MKPSAIALFPFRNNYEDNSLQRTHTIEDTLLSAIRAFLVTRKGSRVGSMIGSFLPDLLMDLVGIEDLSGLSDELKMELIGQFPGVNFIKVKFDLDRSNSISDLIVTISFSTNSSDNIMTAELIFNGN